MVCHFSTSYRALPTTHNACDKDTHKACTHILVSMSVSTHILTYSQRILTTQLRHWTRPWMPRANPRAECLTTPSTLSISTGMHVCSQLLYDTHTKTATTDLLKQTTPHSIPTLTQPQTPKPQTPNPNSATRIHAYHQRPQLLVHRCGH